MHASRAAAAGALCVSVPHSHLITLSLARGSDIGRVVTGTGRPFLSRQSFLAAFLLQERAKGARSHFYPYIAALPLAHPSLPCYLPPPLLSMLAGTRAASLLRQFEHELVADYLTLMFASPCFSLDDWQWARCCVSSRVFGVAELLGEREELVLAPLIDLLNHAQSERAAMAWGWSEAAGCFLCESRLRLQPGDEVTISYGDKCNSQLFAAYGFAVADNRHDGCSLSFSLPEGDDERLRMQKTQLLHLMHDNLAEQLSFSLTVDAEDEEARRMLSYLRLCEARQADISGAAEEHTAARRRAGTRGAPEPARVAFISRDNELRVWRRVREEASARLSEFETTAQTDERLLADGRYAEGSSERLCLLVRLSEKRVLRWWLQASELCLQLLDGGMEAVFESEQRTEEMGLDLYVTDSLVPALRYRPRKAQLHRLAELAD